MPLRRSAAGGQPVAAVALAGASLVAAAGVGSIFLSSARDAWTAIAAAGPASPADGILLVVAQGGVFLSLWLGLGVALSALSALPGAMGQACRVLADRLAPAAARKIVALVLGTTLTAALVPVTAGARAGHATPRQASLVATEVARGGLTDAAPNASFRLVRTSVPAVDPAPPPSWSPDKPTPSARHASAALGGVVVHRGDTLWSIAARHLGPAATCAQIDAEWHRWFAANREVIGADADAILPGQLLKPPAPPQGRS